MFTITCHVSSLLWRVYRFADIGKMIRYVPIRVLSCCLPHSSIVYDVRQFEKLSPGKIKTRSGFMLSIPQAIIPSPTPGSFTILNERFQTLPGRSHVRLDQLNNPGISKCKKYHLLQICHSGMKPIFSTGDYLDDWIVSGIMF